MSIKEKEILKNMKKEEKALTKDIMTSQIKLKLKINKLKSLKKVIAEIEKEIEK